MKANILLKSILLAFIAVAFASCSSEEWDDTEAHEKTEQLRKQYTQFIIGTWHFEKSLDKRRAFEQLTFNADGTLSGIRKWQTRELVTVGDTKQYTNWEDVPDENGTFTGTWSLEWIRNNKNVGENCINLYARWDENDNSTTVYSHIAYSHHILFGDANETTLKFAGIWQNSDGWISYQRGEAEPSF